MKISPSILSLIIIAVVFSINESKKTDDGGKMPIKIPHGNVDAIHKKKVEKESMSIKNYKDGKPKMVNTSKVESTMKKDADNKNGIIKKLSELPRKLKNENRKLATKATTKKKNNKQHLIAENNFLKLLKNQKAMRRQFCYENCRKPVANANKLMHNRNQHQKHEMPDQIAAIHRQKRALIECNQCNNLFDDNEWDACPNCDPHAINIGGDVTSDDEENRHEVDGVGIEEVDNNSDAPSNDSGEEAPSDDSDNDNNGDSDDENADSEHSSDSTEVDTDSD